MQQNDQKAASIKNRKIKLLSIIKDYKSEFENQIKRRELNRFGDKKNNKKDNEELFSVVSFQVTFVPSGISKSPTFAISSVFRFR